MIPLLLAVAVIILAPLQSSAQPPMGEDIRISPLEPYSLLLPEELRIESAAANGTTTLVVWGTREPLGKLAIPALRMQLVRNGSATGSPALLHSTVARPSRFVRLIAEGNGFNVFWYDLRQGDTGLYRQRVDLDGARVGDEAKVIDGKIIDMVTYDELPRLTLLLWEKATAVLLLPDGSIDSSGLEQTALAAPHIISADSSLVSVEGDSVFFRSSFRNGVITQRLHLPDSAVLPGMATIGRNARGEIILTWIAQPSDVRPYVPPSDASIVFLVMQSTIIERSAYSAPRTLDTISLWTYSACHPRVGLESTSRQHHEGGFRVTLTLYISGQCPNQNRETITYYPASFQIGSDGSYARDPVAPRPARADELPLARLRYDTSSVVVTFGGTDTVTVSTPIAPINIGIAQFNPALLSRGGKVLAIWQEGLIVVRHRTAYDTGAGAPLSIGVGESYSEAQRATHVVKAYPHVLSDGIVIDEFNGIYGPGGSTTTHTLFAATETGWQQIFSRGTGAPPTRRISYSRDPNSTLLCGAVEAVSDRLLFYTFDELGRSTATFDHPLSMRGEVQIVPVDSTTFLLIAESLLLKATATGIDTIAPITTADRGTVERYQRLYGEFFLRTILSADGHLVKAERYRLDGTFLESSSIALRYPATDHAVALDRSDSSIFILCGSSHGVRMSHLRSDLSVLQSDVRASVTEDEVHHPSGVVVGDSLHVAWEDSRVGNSDIFGFVIGAPFDGVSRVEPLPASSKSHARHGSISITAVSPNPAGDVVSLEIELIQDADVAAEIRDMRGHCVRSDRKRFDAGESRWNVDIRSLASGMYIVSIKSGNCVDMRKLIVLQTR